MAKKALNWPEIKARFLAGERPSEIASDYRNCTPAKISQKASREKWVQEREEICNSVAPAVEKQLAEQITETTVRISTQLRSNATKAAIIEGELLDAQLKMIRHGREFIEFLEEAIRQVAFAEEDDPKMAFAVIKELRHKYDAIFEKMVPSKLVVSAFTSARAESDLVADEEHERERQRAQGGKKEGMKFILNVKHQSDALKELPVEDAD